MFLVVAAFSTAENMNLNIKIVILCIRDFISSFSCIMSEIYTQRRIKKLGNMSEMKFTHYDLIRVVITFSPFFLAFALSKRNTFSQFFSCLRL